MRLPAHDIRFRSIFAFFIVDINTKRVVHVRVTQHPTAQWTAQQIRDATPFGVPPAFIIRDNDGTFGADFDRVVEGAGTHVLRTAVRAPLMNSVCERFLGSVRRERLDHIIVLGERHLSQVLNEYCVRYFNTARPHQGIEQRVPYSDAKAKFYVRVAGGRQRRLWRAVGEALGVQGVRRVERRLAHGVHAAEEHLGGREECQAAMLVLVVVPAEERLSHPRAWSRPAKKPG